jgi:hypothetical protein
MFAVASCAVASGVSPVTDLTNAALCAIKASRSVNQFMAIPQTQNIAEELFLHQYLKHTLNLRAIEVVKNHIAEDASVATVTTPCGASAMDLNRSQLPSAVSFGPRRLFS